MHSAVAEVREALARRFPGALPLEYRTTPVVPTGVAGLDRLLPNGGIPRGRLTVWAPGGGTTAVLRSACRSVVRSGGRAAWVDGDRTVSGEAWPEGVLLVRPRVAEAASGCAEELLRSGGFALVVLGAAGTKVERSLSRLGRAVREGGGGFVAVSSASSLAHLRIASRIVVGETIGRENPFGELAAIDSVVLVIEAQSLGWSGRTVARVRVHGTVQRIGLDPLLVDRRGAPHRSGTWGSRSRGSVRAGRDRVVG
ncbi:MAG: hypothetical protein L0271_22455 [Gemmatimonadetes bacterium]|nr:hypothetical protein [Gemmatimonadota bacterium]